MEKLTYLTYNLLFKPLAMVLGACMCVSGNLCISSERFHNEGLRVMINLTKISKKEYFIHVRAVEYLYEVCQDVLSQSREWLMVLTHKGE